MDKEAIIELAKKNRKTKKGFCSWEQGNILYHKYEFTEDELYEYIASVIETIYLTNE